MTSSKIVKGRQAEATRIRRANRASAVGRLMLGGMSNWQEFFEADTVDLQSLPRRILKAGAKDVRGRVSKKVKKFCQRNFQNLTQAKLDLLYEDVKAFRGLKTPLKEFEQKYGKVRRSVFKDAPSHSTVVISLWGLQFKSPEDYLAKDVLQALTWAIETHSALDEYQKESHRTALDKKDILE